MSLQTLKTSGGTRTVVDGGLLREQPGAIRTDTDATVALGAERDCIRLLSVGTGSYPGRRRAVMGIVKTAVPTA